MARFSLFACIYVRKIPIALICTRSLFQHQTAKSTKYTDFKNQRSLLKELFIIPRWVIDVSSLLSAIYKGRNTPSIQAVLYVLIINLLSCTRNGCSQQ